MKLTVNGQPSEASDGATIESLLVQLGLAGKPVAVELNLELIPRARHGARRLAEGDRLEIVTLVGGG